MLKSLRWLPVLWVMVVVGPLALVGAEIFMKDDMKTLLEYDDKQEFLFLETARLKKSPTWKAGVDKRPMVSVEEAYSLATKELQGAVKTPAEWECASLKLERVGEKVWYWEVCFLPTTDAKEGESFYVYVYLDGAATNKRTKAVFK